jgi:hypothetical protein
MAETFLGIHLSENRHTLTFAALDGERRILALASGGVEEGMAYAAGAGSALICLDVPYGQDGSTIREWEQDNPHSPPSWSITRKPGAPHHSAAWKLRGRAVYQQLADHGYRPFPVVEAPRQWLESQPEAGFCCLLGQRPLPADTLEGRMQRQMALVAQDLGLPNPMDFLEEITRHKLLTGQLPLEMISPQAELDALVLALTAWRMGTQPEEGSQIGPGGEHTLYLPGRLPLDEEESPEQAPLWAWRIQPPAPMGG